MYLDKTKIRQSFAAASVTYDGVAELQRTVGQVLLDTCNINSMTGTLLDLGCGTGFLINELLRHAQPIIALDIALPMLQVTRTKLGYTSTVDYICADAEQLPLVEKAVDHVFSNLALQWCVNLEAVFSDIKRVIKPGGQLFFSTFGPQTLQELKAAWASVDDYSHVNDFYTEQQLRHFLQLAGFAEITIESNVYISRYDSVLALMKELKHIGAHNVLAGRNKNITTKSQMQRMIAAYEQCRTDGLIPATFEVIMVKAS
ncbi:MAG: malonyl-ACP O-methyltransferase BioC [Methylobacter sp.]